MSPVVRALSVIEPPVSGVPFSGFEPEDFAVFDIPDFAGRMAAVRARIKPKLATLGGLILPCLADLIDGPMHTHVAQHMRRTVNPPKETWVAFARSARAYKPYIHFRAAISREGIRTVVFVEDDAGDKLRFAGNLKRSAAGLASYFAHHPEIRAYDIPDRSGLPAHGSGLRSSALKGFGERLSLVKGQHAAFGIALAADHPVVQSGAETTDSIVHAIKTLLPLYQLGTADTVRYKYAPQPEITLV